MNKHDSTYATVIDSNTLLINFNNLNLSVEMQNLISQQIAKRHFWAQLSSVITDYGKNVNSGTKIYTYHMTSIKPNLWVVSTIELNQSIAKIIVTNHLVKKNNEIKS